MVTSTQHHFIIILFTHTIVAAAAVVIAAAVAIAVTVKGIIVTKCWLRSLSFLLSNRIFYHCDILVYIQQYFYYFMSSLPVQNKKKYADYSPVQRGHVFTVYISIFFYPRASQICPPFLPSFKSNLCSPFFDPHANKIYVHLLQKIKSMPSFFYSPTNQIYAHLFDPRTNQIYVYLCTVRQNSAVNNTKEVCYNVEQTKTFYFLS